MWMFDYHKMYFSYELYFTLHEFETNPSHVAFVNTQTERRNTCKTNNNTYFIYMYMYVCVYLITLLLINVNIFIGVIIIV